MKNSKKKKIADYCIILFILYKQPSILNIYSNYKMASLEL